MSARQALKHVYFRDLRELENPGRSNLSPTVYSKASITENENEEVDPRRNKKGKTEGSRLLPEINQPRKIELNTMKYGKSPFLTKFKKQNDGKTLVGNNSNKFLTLGVGKNNAGSKKIEVKKQY